MTDPAIAAAKRRKRLVLLVAAATTSALLLLLLLLRGDRLRALLSGRSKDRRAPTPLTLRLEHPPDRETLARIDHARVHAVLWPTWVRQRHAAGDDSARAKAALAALRGALRGERNLVALLDELARRVRRDLRGQAARVLYLCWSWGAYLQKHGQPWRLVGGLRRGKTASDDVFYVKTYRVLYSTQRPTRLSLLQRADPLDLGADPVARASLEEGAFVEADGLERLAVNALWPLLDARADAELSAAERRLAKLLRPVVARALPRQALVALRDSVGDRLVLRQTARAINARARCGSRFRLGAIPWWGLSTADEAAIGDAIKRSGDRAKCPEVKKDEQRSLLAASDRLARREALRQAVGALVAWLARGAALEALALHAALRAELRCNARCPTLARAQQGATHARLAALLTTLAHGESGYAALLRLCVGDGDGDGDALRSPAHSARQATLAALGEMPCSQPPKDLAARARAARKARFGALPQLPSAPPHGLPARLLPRPPPK